MEDKTGEVLASCGFRFKKQFGQNFITDGNLLSSIVESSGVGADDTVVEIGCGAGTLTRAIASRVKRVLMQSIISFLFKKISDRRSGTNPNLRSETVSFLTKYCRMSFSI